MSGVMRNNGVMFWNSVAGVMEKEDEAQLIASLMKKVRWRTSNLNDARVIERIFESWLAGWKNDAAAIRDGEILLSTMTPRSEDQLSKERSSGIANVECDIGLLKSLVRDAQELSGNHESSAFGRIGAVRRAIHRQEASSRER